MSPYTLTIIFEQNKKIATYTFDCPKNPQGYYQLHEGDRIQFIFNNPEVVVTQAILSSTMKHLPERTSPFSGFPGGTVELINNSILTIGAPEGRWCFWINFHTQNDAGWMVHLLPDPELQVGSIPNSADIS